MTDSSQRHILKILHEKVIAWAAAGTLKVVCGQPPIALPEGVRLAEQPSPLVPATAATRFSLSNMTWPELRLVAHRFPLLGCILEGEADFCIGVTEERARAVKSLDPRHGIHVLSLPAGSFFMVPAGVPYGDDSHRLHWERDNPALAQSRILWLQILPAGAFVHLCSTKKQVHTHSDASLVQNSNLSVLTELLIDAAQQLPASQALVNSCLLTLLLSLAAELASRQHVTHHHLPAHSSFVHGGAGAVSADSSHATVERARHYIRSHMIEPLTVAQIAGHAYVSVPKLKRLFRAELDTSVMQYVAGARLAEARALLADTGLSVHAISAICGFRHRTYFSRVFTRAYGQSPLAFRLAHQQAAATTTVRRSPKKRP